MLREVGPPGRNTKLGGRGWHLVVGTAHALAIRGHPAHAMAETHRQVNDALEELPLVLAPMAPANGLTVDPQSTEGPTVADQCGVDSFGGRE